MNENEIVTGTTAPTESVTAAPVSEETAVSGESVTTDVTDISEVTASEISETEETSSSMTLPEGIDPDALISSIAAEEVAEVAGEVSVSEEYVTETATVQEPLLTEAAVETEAVVSETAESVVTEKVTEAAEIAESATVETEVTEVVAVPEPPNGVMGFVQSNPAVVGVPAAIIALAVAFLAVTRRTRPKRGIIENNDDVKENMNARERDAARLEANKPKKKDKRSQKVAKEKEKKDFAKKVLNTIPYKKILADDIFFLGKKMYSKAYTFDDINFNLSDEEQQYTTLDPKDMPTLGTFLECMKEENENINKDMKDKLIKLIEEYMKLIEKELDITEADYRKFGAADNTKAQEYYQKLIDEGAISNNFWNVETPIGEEDSDE